MKITKMQGLGNDFVIVDYEEFKKTGLSMSELAIKLCNRHFGIGADGMIIPDASTSQSADIGWYFYNSDGSTAQMCGNGMRCFAKYVYDKKLVNKKSFSVRTLAGIIKPELLENGLVKVDMGAPILEDEKIPFKGERKLTALDREFEINPVSMGNPHCIIFTEEDPMYLAETYGPTIEKHEFFPEKTNTEFVKIKSREEVDMRVYERGCGITLACGTGACATVVAGVLNNLTEHKVKVNLLGGSVIIEWCGSQDDLEQHVYMTGRADYSFFAEYIL
ncbi:diaminopimelate epimerase [bacterium]|nr:diaminopimelate epimerase [bacterium]